MAHDNETPTPADAGPVELWLGPLPEGPVGVLIRGYGGAWRFSCGEFLLSLYQQPAGDHPLFTETQVRAMLAAELERRTTSISGRVR